MGATATRCAKGMAKWVQKDWVINSREDDLDDYTYYVAGLVEVSCLS